jgi:regulator of protease activity HflC (stomatin/prohibitin superfamily)
MIIALIVVIAVLVLAGSAVRVITEYERGVVLRFGRVLPRTRSPGLAVLVPVADRLNKVNMQIVTMPVPASTPSVRSPRPRCARSSARAIWTTCCRTGNASTRAWN